MCWLCWRQSFQPRGTLPLLPWAIHVSPKFAGSNFFSSCAWALSLLHARMQIHGSKAKEPEKPQLQHVQSCLHHTPTEGQGQATLWASLGKYPRGTSRWHSSLKPGKDSRGWAPPGPWPQTTYRTMSRGTGQHLQGGESHL